MIAFYCIFGYSVLTSILLALSWRDGKLCRRGRGLMARSLGRSLRRERKLKSRICDLEATQEHLLEERGHFLVELQSLLVEVTQRGAATNPCSALEDM